MKKKLYNRCILICIVLLAFTPLQAQKLRIGIVSIGNLNADHIRIVKKSLEQFYQAKAIQTDIHLPIDSNILSKPTAKARAEAAQFLPLVDLALEAQLTNEKLAGLELTDYDYIIGITDSAFTIGDVGGLGFLKKYPQLYLMRGVANSDLKVATISTYKLKKEAKDAKDFKVCLGLVARHEMAHLLKLGHCLTEKCLMGDALKFTTANEHFCEECINKIDQKYLK